MRIIIHETYEYEVEARDSEHARELFDAYREDPTQREGFESEGFIQNYLHTYDAETGDEI
tara:strand:+ start:67 stop:246 length:180 start_codon:yes stop_codon:yes gene_type:complete